MWNVGALNADVCMSRWVYCSAVYLLRCLTYMLVAIPCNRRLIDLSLPFVVLHSIVPDLSVLDARSRVGSACIIWDSVVVVPSFCGWDAMHKMSNAW